MSQMVFAYGSNMCSGRFRAYSVIPEENGRPALLLDYQLRFNKRSNDGSGKANVEPISGGQVWGVLYTIPDAHLINLDDGEVGYNRERMSVSTTDGALTAWVYVARNPNDDATLRPFTWYKRFLVEGAREHRLPMEYIEALERVEADQDQDEERDRVKRALECTAD